jgi:outer membrane protein assembly factor BamB
VFCLDRDTGELLWQRIAAEQVPHESHHLSHGYASASPTTDGERLYVSFGSRGIYCYDLAGNLLWQRNLGKMNTRREFGEGASPVICNGTLIVNWDHEGDSFITALDAETGVDRWRTPRDEATTWATPLVVEHNGVTNVVVNGSNRTRSYDLATGELLWQCGGQVANPIPSPVAANGVVYCMSGYQGYAVTAISLGSRGEITGQDRELWHADEAAPYVASPVLVDGLLYFTKSETGILCCREAPTGKPVFGKRRLPQMQTIYSSPVAAAGRLYITDRDGTTLVIRVGTEFEILATNQLDDMVDATLVPLDKQLLIRGASTLYCIENSRPQSSSENLCPP